MTDPVRDTTRKIDSTIGEGVALASNKVAPIIGPVVTRILWKHKWKILGVFLTVSCFLLFALESLAFQATASSRNLLNEIPVIHKECIQKSIEGHNVEFELVAAYSKVISNFNENHSSSGIGFLEITKSNWSQYSEDGSKDGSVDSQDACDNYFTLVNVLDTLYGDSQARIEQYSYEDKDSVNHWYLLYKGLTFIPFGNPVGLDRSELVVVTSGYNVVRVIDGRKHVHKGVDLVPSSTWFKENPGKGSTDAINYSIITGKAHNFKDQYGALCSYVENEKYRTLYCHCDSFIVQDQAKVKYGDPICFMGNTGFSKGTHTHVGLSEKVNGVWYVIDPTPFLFPANY